VRESSRERERERKREREKERERERERERKSMKEKIYCVFITSTLLLLHTYSVSFNAKFERMERQRQ
jgi:hypothetical protein